MRVSVLSSLTLVAGSAAAQTISVAPPPPAAPHGAVIFTNPGHPGNDNHVRVMMRALAGDSAKDNQATLGMMLSATGSKRDTLGVFVARVEPDGPAEKAGIIEGDRIVSINNVDLRSSTADLDDSYTAGIPIHRIKREVLKLTPGAKVNIRVYQHGGSYKNFTVTAGKRSAPSFQQLRIGGVGADFGPAVAAAVGPDIEPFFLQTIPAPADAFHVQMPSMDIQAPDAVFEMQPETQPGISVQVQPEAGLQVSPEITIAAPSAGASVDVPAVTEMLAVPPSGTIDAPATLFAAPAVPGIAAPMDIAPLQIERSSPDMPVDVAPSAGTMRREMTIEL